jgi:hypothetical protein
MLGMWLGSGRQDIHEQFSWQELLEDRKKWGGGAL